MRLFALALLSLPALVLAEPAKLDFNYDIRPILSTKCFHCHGPDESARKAKLRLDVRDDALRERDGDTPIVPNDPAKSELCQRIDSTDPEEVMPPPKEGQTLTATERAILKRWIAEGAEYKEHWAWTAPVRPEIPAAAPIHPIDAFIDARLKATGLHRSPEADRPTLLRRLSFDLIGLPPTQAEVAAFVQDTSPDYYEKAVDRLLASPRFGEKWAHLWLDLARYADSTGYGSDFLRLGIWPYRDWVINAFNRNLPFDQFTIEQLAGDLLPKPTQDQIIATAFNRNTMTNVEGGTVREEYRTAAVKDRISTTAEVWMGLTLQCAQCHSHKFDPISQTEYYQVFAIFNQTEDNDQPTEVPTLPLPQPGELERLKALNDQLATLQTAAKANTSELEIEQSAWEAATLQGDDKAKAAIPTEVFSILDLEPTERTDAQRAKVLAYFRSISPTVKKLQAQITAKQAEIKKAQPTAVPIMRELAADHRRESHLLTKGNYLIPAQKVAPALPAKFAAGSPADGLVDRLTVAKWLVAPENPLTARVTVNRFWAQLFGTGIVETEEDFGTQGALPTHPELLDWLAVTFRSPVNADRSQLGLGWDMKALLKLIVTSGTYRQSSRTIPGQLERDARNRLLSHYPRRRLEAEQVRDQALALSGLLSSKIGGPSVYPPQPDGLWQVAFNGGQNGYPTSQGEDRYRRALYTIWRRTKPYPSMATFDAPSRESCTLRRIPTNTPLQAFVTLNDPCFVECSQALARRILRDGGSDNHARLAWALDLALAHSASEEQIAVLQKLLTSELENYHADSAAAAKLAASPTLPLPPGADVAELAAWTVVANVILNLDGVLTKS